MTVLGRFPQERLQLLLEFDLVVRGHVLADAKGRRQNLTERGAPPEALGLPLCVRRAFDQLAVVIEALVVEALQGVIASAARMSKASKIK